MQCSIARFEYINKPFKNYVHELFEQNLDDLQFASMKNLQQGEDVS